MSKNFEHIPIKIAFKGYIDGKNETLHTTDTFYGMPVPNVGDLILLTKADYDFVVGVQSIVRNRDFLFLSNPDMILVRLRCAPLNGKIEYSKESN